MPRGEVMRNSPFSAQLPDQCRQLFPDFFPFSVEHEELITPQLTRLSASGLRKINVNKCKTIYSDIDFMKLVMAAVIVIHHAGVFYFINGVNICPTGYMMVEFFFYVSGFFMMSKAARINEDTSKKRIGSTTADYVLSKYKALIPYTLYAVIVGIIASAIIQKMGYRQIIFNIANCWIDVLFLQMYGFYGVIITGVSWYLSAMIIAIMILFPFCVKFGRNVLPFFTLLSLLIYGFLSMICICNQWCF